MVEAHCQGEKPELALRGYWKQKSDVHTTVAYWLLVPKLALWHGNMPKIWEQRARPTGGINFNFLHQLRILGH